MSRRLSLWIALAALVGLSIWAYLPGLSGGFLFDDFINLHVLGKYGRVDDWTTFWRYITSGGGDPTGRPIALLSFLIDADNWPASPYPFKRTSLIVHLLNGALLFVLLARLGRIVGHDASRARSAAALAAALWVLHPLWVSTTLYIVQREAMLPATFTLLGLIAYTGGRVRIATNRPVGGALLMASGVVVGGALATLSKANGVLLPLLVAVVEVVLLAPSLRPASARDRRVLDALRVALLYVPSLLVVAYLVSRIPGSIEIAPKLRAWTLGERVLTETRILFQYLALLIVPRPFSTGLFNDSVVVSTSLTTPWTTLPAVLGAVALPFAAWWARRRTPVLAAAVLFFLAGHLLESTVIALELYFEHRNYLPAMLLPWPLALALTGPGRYAAARKVACIALPLMVAFMTHARATLWGNAQEQALVWAALMPDSPRAQANAAQFETAAGRPDAAVERLERALAVHPDEVQLTFNLLSARCRQGSVAAADLSLVTRSLREARHGMQLTFKWLDDMIAPVAAGRCSGLDLGSLDALIAVAQANPRLNDGPGREQELAHIQGRIALLRGDVAAALERFDAAFKAQPRLESAMKQAALLGSAGRPDAALAHLDYVDSLSSMLEKPAAGMPRLHAWVLDRQGYWPTERAHLRAVLERDAAAQRPRTD